MPYIEQKDRMGPTMIAETPGELNYLITILIKEYIEREGLNYATLNSVIGVLECAKQELYRRVAVPYENAKCELNGDVY